MFTLAKNDSRTPLLATRIVLIDAPANKVWQTEDFEGSRLKREQVADAGTK